MTFAQSDGSKIQTLVGICCLLIKEAESVSGMYLWSRKSDLKDPKVLTKDPLFCVSSMHLAYEELHIVLAGIFRKYDLYDDKLTEKPAGPTLALYDTTRRDIDIVADLLLAGVSKGSKGVRVVAR